MDGVARALLALACAIVTIGGCAGEAGDSPGGTVSPTPSATVAPLSQVLAGVDWPDDEPTIERMFESLPDELAGLGIVSRIPDPTATASGEQADGWILSYGPPGGAAQVTMIADPGAGVSNPADGMVSVLVYSGGPARCIDADYSPVFADLFGMESEEELFAELRRSAERDPPEGLYWVICTMTYDGDNDRPLTRGEWTYLAYWADGGWGYILRARSPELREAGVLALVDAARAASA